MDLLRGEFGKDFISHSAPNNWPLRLCDLTPLGYFCGAMLKLMTIQTSPLELTHWKTKLKHEIPAEILERVCQNTTKRMDHLKRSRDQHLREVIFKY